MTKMWIDDIRKPEMSEYGLWAVNSQEAIRYLEEDEHGFVTFISFDHDLGGQDTGYKVACWIETQVATGKMEKPPEYSVHSMNPVGRERIIAAMENAWRIYHGRLQELREEISKNAAK